METFPTSCTVADLPEARYGPMPFLTADAPPSVATCGGWTSWGTTSSCLTLQGGQWVGGGVGDLPGGRGYGSAVTLPGHGVYLVGGTGDGDKWDTSDFLAAGTTVWVEGPALPVAMYYPCTVPLPSSFLAIYGRYVRELDTSSGWRSADTWPRLLTRRTYQPGCAVRGQQAHWV